MFKMIKTTVITALAAFVLTAGLSTQAKAQSIVQFSGHNFVQNTQFNGFNTGTYGGGFRSRGFSRRNGFNRGFRSNRGFGINRGHRRSSFGYRRY